MTFLAEHAYHQVANGVAVFGDQDLVHELFCFGGCILRVEETDHHVTGFDRR